MLLEENTIWFDIGEVDSDRYEEQQQIIREFSFPSVNPIMPLSFPNDSFDDDVPF